MGYRLDLREPGQYLDWTGFGRWAPAVPLAGIPPPDDPFGGSSCPTAMRSVSIGPWTVSVDAEATRAIHARLSAGEGEPCGCPECRNFFAVAEETYPAEAKALFRELGAEPLFVSELSHLGRGADGRYGLVGWFHVVGTVEGPRPSASHPLEGHRLTDAFRVWASADDMLAPKLFHDHPLVQVEFSASVPWALGEAPPDEQGPAAAEPGAAADAELEWR